ncbi:MAG: hypothetical protein NTZ30_04645 [Planctomycetota bacterium]|nr:hypothetical protein [Planctomycetota bacterium]
MKLLDSLNTPVTRGRYAQVGFSLMLVKYAIDILVAWVFFEKLWSPRKYIIWPDDDTVTFFNLGPDDRNFGLTMLALSIPFIIIGTVMTFRRLLSADLPRGLVVLFFVPVLNLFLIGLLCLLPAKVLSPLEEVTILEPPTPKLVPPTWGVIFRSTVVSCMITVPLAFFGANILQNYGFGLFIGLPFAHGFFSVLSFGWHNPQPFGSCMKVGYYSSLLAFLLLFFLAIEGAICLIMFIPIGLVLSNLGCVLGYLVQRRPASQAAFPLLLLLQFPGLPLLMGMEQILQDASPIREVISVIEINAPPEKVWPQVIAFPPIPEANRHWMFLTGIAYPIRAEIEGKGVGAVRNCIFSTGPFVEPITRWDEPNRLSFDVASQPCPMKEWSPYNIHPPHLDHHLISKKGEFRLIRLEGNRTRLEGSTWYSNNMWPNGYWGMWSDAILHGIHLRVLDHIRTEAEKLQ